MSNSAIDSSEIDYSFVPPGELPDDVLGEVCDLVEAGGGVDKRWVRYNLERAFLIARAHHRDRLVGVSSLKHPRPEYIERMREKLGIDIEGFVERGYTSIRPEYRGLGLGTRLLAGLTSRAEGKHFIYSLIREEDLATQTIALRNNTVKVAKFFSELMVKEVGFWMPAKTAQALGFSPIDATGESNKP